MKMRFLPILLALAIGASSAAAGLAPVVATIPPLSASADADRTFADIPLAAPAAAPAALTLAFADPVPPAAVRAVTVHLRCGAGWRSASLPAERARGSVRLPFGAFSTVEGDPGPAEKADLARVSLWRRAPGVDTPPIGIESAGLTRPAAVAVAGAGSDADRCVRLLDRLGVPHDRIAATVPADALAGVRVVFLPETSALSSADTARLRAFVRRGGRLIVFYSGDSALASAVGVRPGVWEPAASGTEWTGFALRNSGRHVPHATANRICPVPGPDARIVATWIAANGTDTGKPAVVLGPGGAWFAHVPPRAYPAACELVGGLLAELAPDLAPPPQPEKEPVPPVTPPPGFLVAAWASAPPKGQLPLPAAPLRALFVRAPRGAPFPQSAGPEGPVLHVWIPCLGGDEGVWHDPADPAVRHAVAAKAARFARAGAAGIHLDYVRSAAGTPATPERTAAVTALVRDVSAAVRAERSGTVVSAAVFPTPADAAAVNQDWPAWVRDGLVDFVCPMIYADDDGTFRAQLDACLAAAPASALLPGIGTGADESQADADAARAELSACIDAGCRGAAFFLLDDALLELLPGLLSR